MKFRPLIVSAAALVAAAGLALAQPTEKRPERSRGPQAAAPAQDFPKTMPVPEDKAKLGTVYYCVSAKERQITIRSEAPVENIDGYSNNVVGYAVAGPKDNPAKLAAGEWRLPVASIDTGNRMRNTHLTQAPWLDAAKNPDITFKLTEVKDIGTPKTDEKTGATSYECTLLGDMTMHGVTKPLTVTGAKLAFLKGNETTAKEVAGDLMMLTCKYTIKLSDFNVQNKVIGQKVAENIEISQKIVHSTVQPSTAADKPKEAEAKDDKKPVTAGS